MALTKVSLVDLNAGELILDLDADTSITSDTDDTIHFKIGGSDEITITGTALSPSTSDGNALGTSALEWSDLFLADGAVINFGDDQDVSLTHVADTGLLLSSTDQLQFGDSGTYIHQSADGVLDLVSDTEIEINATTIDVNGNLDVSGTIVGAGALTAATSITVGSAVLTEAELETLDGITVGTAIASKVVTTDANIDTTGQRNLTITGELDAATGDFSGDVDIDGTANLDTVDIDGATQIDATVTVGVDDTGYDVKFFGATSGAHLLWDESVDDLILAGAARVVVPEGNLVLGSTAVTSTAAELNLLDGVSGLVQADLTKLAAIDATAVEINLIDGGATVGTTAVADGDGLLHNDNGTMRVTSAATFKTYFQEGISTAYDDLTAGDAAVLITTSSGNITIDAAASDSDIILKGTDGGADTTFLTIDGSAAGEATFNAGVIAPALTIDDVAVDGKVITMTGSSGDTFVTTVAANGATSLVTTDAAAAAAHLTITADGTVDINSAGVLTLDSGAAINIEPASGSAILLDGTISVDAGVVTGATSITSTAFVGGLTGNVTGNASGTALTVTQAAQSAITSVGTLTTLTVDEMTLNTDTLTATDTFTVDAVDDITLNSDNSGRILFGDASVIYGIASNSSSDFVLEVGTNDKDMLFKGQDGGASITALSLDMSDGGVATFNAGAEFKGNVLFGVNSDPTLILRRTGNAAANGSIDFQGNDGVVDGSITFAGSTAAAMQFSTAVSNAVSIHDTGRVGIGLTSAPGAHLHLDPPTNVTTGFGAPLMKVGGSNSWASNGLFSIGFGYVTATAADKAPAEIGIKTTNNGGDTKGALVFATRDDLDDATAPTERFRIGSDGTLTGTDTSIGSNSDERLKENIADYTYALSNFKNLRPRTFDWRNPSEHNGASDNRGFIAQEIKAVDSYWTGEVEVIDSSADYGLVEVEVEGDDNTHIALTSKLGKKDAMYVSVIKQLISKIETLETKVQALEDA